MPLQISVLLVLSCYHNFKQSSELKWLPKDVSYGQNICLHLENGWMHGSIVGGYVVLAGVIVHKPPAEK